VQQNGLNGIIELIKKIFLEDFELVTQMQGISVRFEKEIQKYRQQWPTWHLPLLPVLYPMSITRK